MNHLQQKEKSNLKAGNLIPLLMGVGILILLILIILNEIFWVPGANAGETLGNVELWLVISPGFIIIVSLFCIFIRRSRASKESSMQVQLENVLK